MNIQTQPQPRTLTSVSCQEESHYWFYLEPYTYAALQEDHLLLYNTLNGTSIEVTDNPVVTDLMKRVTDRKNMLTLSLSQADLDNEPIGTFVREIRRRFMGDIIDARMLGGKPIQIPSDAKIMKALEKQPEGKIDHQGLKIVQNLTGLTLYLNDSSAGLESFREDAYKQFSAPCSGLPGQTVQQLNIDHLLPFLEEARYGMLDHIKILGGNIFEYPHLGELVEVLNRTFPGVVDKDYYIRYTQLAGLGSVDLEFLKGNGTENFLDIIVDFPIQRELWEHCLQILAEVSVRSRFHFVIESEKQFKQAEQLIDDHRFRVYTYEPYYNKKNLGFFQEAVFSDREEIFDARPSMRKIQARSLVNPLRHGQLYVMSNGHIHAGMNEPKIGKLNQDSLHQYLYNAVTSSKSWNQRRCDVNPCRQCVFQSLCPPISGYENTLGRYNLCHIK